LERQPANQQQSKAQTNNNLPKLGLQLHNYDMRHDDSFKGLNNMIDLSIKLVEIKRHKVCDMVYELLKLVLLLPVVTASVERIFFWNGFSENNVTK
jgi:hypothetical protein